MNPEPTTLITTKLHRPPVTGDLVPRPRLVERLSHGLLRPLTLVCAGAGFGKSTLVSSWLAGNDDASRHCAYAWLSLDEHDGDLAVFLRYFIAAVQTVFFDACPQIRELIKAQQQPPLELLAATLINEIALLPGPLVLVLDDYGSIQGEAVHGLLNRMLQHWPQTMHLVLITRRNPPLPLPRLRAKGLINEVRSGDLRFTQEEMVAYLNKALPAPLSPPALALLEQRCEGWIAGLQLAALSLQASTSDEATLAILSSADANAAEYLVDEVLASQPLAIQTFLLRTSILDRFCAPLCEAVAGAAEPQWTVQACLEWIQRSNLFVIALDLQQEWYRYHHLFQEMLRQRLGERLGADEVTCLHRRAASWLAGNGLIDEALHHALAAGDLEQAARLMEHGLCDVLNREDWPTLDRWLRLLPEALIQHRPWLLMIRAWSLSFSWQLGAVSQVLHQVEALIDEGGGAMLDADDRYSLQSLRGQVFGLRGQESYVANQPARALSYCQEALALVPEVWMYPRGGFVLYLAASMQALGQGDDVERLLIDTYEGLADKSDSYATRLLFARAYTQVQSGNLELARQAAQGMLHQAAHRRLSIVQGWAHFYLGLVAYQWNDLYEAGQHFAKLVDKRYVAHAHAGRNGMLGLALVHQARGESTQAWETLDLLSRFDLEQAGYETDDTHSLRALLQMHQGNLESAARWADSFAVPVPDRPVMWLQHPHITKARILLARGTPADAQGAQEIGEAIYEIAKQTYNTRFQITSLLIRALALDAQGQARGADTALQQAIELAQPGGFVRVFVDLGPRMPGMLSRLAGQGFAVETIQRILAAFRDEEVRVKAEEGAARPMPRPSPRVVVLVEPLTGREREILTLLREPLSGKEIARRLTISSQTVKRHMSNIYGKLGVHNRWDAVRTAESLGILPPR